MLALDHTLRPVPRLARLETNTVGSGCGGVADAFGYEAAMAIGGLNLLRAVDRNAFTARGGTGRCHLHAGEPDRQAWHAADMLEQALP